MGDLVGLRLRESINVQARIKDEDVRIEEFLVLGIKLTIF